MWSINPNLIWLIAGTIAALTIGTVIRIIALRSAPADLKSKRIGSLKVWWVLTLLWSTAALLGQPGAAVLLAIASFIGLKEYLRLIGATSSIGHVMVVCLLVCGMVHYALIIGGIASLARILFPIGMLLLLGVVRSLAGNTIDYIRITAGVYWGAMLLIYGISHTLFLFEVDKDLEPLVGNSGWFLYLVLLTEMNDIMQAIVGRRFGKHKISPQVSPNKSLEGLLGGLTTVVTLSILLAPVLTTIPMGRGPVQGIGLSIVAGVLISLFGFLGDINMSAIKRDAGVKDGSSLLPGMGGMIDRIDSLTFTAPAFYYLVLFLNR